MIVIVPKPADLQGNSFSLADLIRWWVDNSEPFQRPISRIRLGMQVLEALDAKPPVVGQELDLPRDALALFRELAEGGIAPVWLSKTTGLPVAIPPRLYEPLFSACLPEAP